MNAPSTKWFSSIALLLLVLFFFSCSNNKRNSPIFTQQQQEQLFHDSSSYLPFMCLIDTPICTDSACYGQYQGVEFVSPEYIDRLQLNGTDVAHQYSNKISQYVGLKLKQLYQVGLYSKVDFRRIRMNTKGMNSGSNHVVYQIYIPFERVPKNEAMTAFDHCGGWGHRPELEKRMKTLLSSPNNIVKNKRLWISKLNKTKEGLQEYWIQWQHAGFQ